MAKRHLYRYAPHNDVSVNDGPHIRRWSHKIVIIIFTLVNVHYSPMNAQVIVLKTILKFTLK